MLRGSVIGNGTSLQFNRNSLKIQTSNPSAYSLCSQVKDERNQDDARIFARAMLQSRLEPSMLKAGITTLLQASSGLFAYLADVTGRLPRTLKSLAQLEELLED